MAHTEDWPREDEIAAATDPDHAEGEPHYVDPVDEPHYYDGDDDNGEWQPGECDMCSGRDVIVDGPLGPLLCACAIGQGAPLNECICGTDDDEPAAASSVGGAQ